MKTSCPVAILEDLVAFQSISKKPNLEIVDYLEHIATSLGFDVVRITSPDEPKRSNLLCKIGPDVAGGLMLSGHMDVVPVAGQNWDYDPFVLTKQEGKLIGRGSADMKGFIAAVCSALRNYPLKKLTKPLTLLWTYDEEVGCIGSAQAAPLLKKYLNHLPDAAWIGEPTDFNVLRMHSGHVTVKISAKGRGAHSSDPSLGVSAIKALNQALNGLFTLEEELKKETSFGGFFKRPFVTMNVGEVHGGTAVNIVPDEAFATIGFRPLPDTPVNVIFERMMAAALKNQQDYGAKITGIIEKISPAMITEADTKLERILRPEANNTGPCSAQYSTDGGNINQTGIECLIFGPGTIDVAHQANEWIYQRDLIACEEKLAKILNGWFI